jgi:hypothetical protein
MVLIWQYLTDGTFWTKIPLWVTGRRTWCCPHQARQGHAAVTHDNRKPQSLAMTSWFISHSCCMSTLGHRGPAHIICGSGTDGAACLVPCWSCDGENKEVRTCVLAFLASAWKWHVSLLSAFRWSNHSDYRGSDMTGGKENVVSSSVSTKKLWIGVSGSLKSSPFP